jgi:hypothetical protein
MSTVKVLRDFFTTVRHAPLTAMLDPRAIRRSDSRVVTVKTAAFP